MNNEMLNCIKIFKHKTVDLLAWNLDSKFTLTGQSEF